MDELRLWLLALVLTTPRLVVCLSVLPLMRVGSMSKLQRGAAILVLGLPVQPLLLQQLHAIELSTFVMVLVVLKECVVGLLMGFVVAIPFWAIEAAGYYIDNQRGAAVAAMFNASSGSESSAFGMLFQQAYTVTYLLHGGFAALLNLYFQSFKVWPLAGVLPTLSTAHAGEYLTIFDALTRHAVVWCAPAMIAMFISELSLALASMFAPQLQVFPLAMGIKSGIAAFVMVVYVDVLVANWQTLIFEQRSSLGVLEKLLQ